MASVFGSLVPVVIPFSGTTDANGNLTITERPRAAFWTSLLSVAKVGGGFPAWEITAGGILAAVGYGQRCAMGPALVAPGDTIKIAVIGAAPSSPVSGSLIGHQAPSLEMLAGVFTPTPSTLAVDTASPDTDLGRLTLPSGNGNTLGFTVPLPIGTFAIALNYVSGALEALSVTGATTAMVYLNINGGIAGSSIPVQDGVAIVPITNPRDTSVNIQLVNQAGPQSAALVDVSAIPVPVPPSSTLGVSTTPQLDGPRPWQTNRPVDSALTSFPATGNQASVVFPATPLRRWVLNYVVTSLFQTGATAGAANLVVLDGATTKLHVALSVAGAPDDIDRMAVSDLQIEGTLNTAMTVQFDASASATIAEAVSAGARLSTT